MTDAGNGDERNRAVSCTVRRYTRAWPLMTDFKTACDLVERRVEDRYGISVFVLDVVEIPSCKPRKRWWSS